MPATEARTLAHNIVANKFYGNPPVQLILEEHARDSTGNEVLSWAAYASAFGRYPRHASIVTFPFKQARFEFTAMLLGLADKITVVGVADPPPGPRLDAARVGEARKLQAIRQDPWLLSPDWSHVIHDRNPRATPIPIFADKEMNAFLAFIYGRGEPAPPPSWRWSAVG